MSDKPTIKGRDELTPEQYAVTREGATERPFTGVYLDNKDSGTYRCISCASALFESDSKYDSGSGWPSFSAAHASDTVETRLDTSHGMRRNEIVCKRCEAHLGHVFEDGPQPTGLRFCVNSAALDFDPADE